MNSRLLLALLPLAVIGIFVLMARRDRVRAPDPAHRGYFERNGRMLGLVFLGLVAFWMLFLIVLPFLYMIEESFHPTLMPAARGGADDVLTFAQYKSLVFVLNTGALNTIHLGAIAYTILVSLLVTALNLILCYPVAFHMAQGTTARKLRLLMLCLIVPYWVNEILRAFALRLLLAAKGMINQMLMGLGLIDAPIDFLGNNVGLFAGLSYAYLLMMIFPLYNALESLDRNQIEAGRDLGAPWWRIHKDIVIPYAKPGIASGCTMVFMLSAGSLAAPQFLGGPRTLWFTSIVYDFFFQNFNWPRGSAYAFVLLVLCIAIVLLALRLFKVSLGETIR